MKHPFSFSRLFLTCSFALSVFFIYSCHKKDATEIPYEITYVGKPMVGQSVQFSSNISGNVKITWVFSEDSGKVPVSYSYDAKPTHMFSMQGLYTVRIIVDGDSANIKGKNPMVNFAVQYPYDPAQVGKITGTRWWNVYQDSGGYGGTPKDTLKRYTETFAISVINDTTIVVKNDTLRAWSFQRENGVVGFYEFDHSTGNFGGSHLAYFVAQDSVVYNIHPDQGGVLVGDVPARIYGVTTTYSSHK